MWKRFLFPQSTWLDKRLLDHVENADLAMDIDFMSGQMPRQESGAMGSYALCESGAASCSAIKCCQILSSAAPQVLNALR
jgi:hypothetical protein